MIDRLAQKLTQSEVPKVVSVQIPCAACYDLEFAGQTFSLVYLANSTENSES